MKTGDTGCLRHWLLYDQGPSLQAAAHQRSAKIRVWFWVATEHTLPKTTRALDIVNRRVISGVGGL